MDAPHPPQHRASARPQALVPFLIPMETPGELDTARVAEYRVAMRAGQRPAALGVSILDIRSPANWQGDVNEYPEHWTLSTFVLDGHHKIQASAESGRAVRLITFISRRESLATGSDVDAAVEALTTLVD